MKNRLGAKILLIVSVIAILAVFASVGECAPKRSPLQQQSLDDAMLRAAMKGDVLGVKRYLSQGANVNAEAARPDNGERHGKTALIIAAENGNLPLVRLLIGHKANIHAVWRDVGETAFTVAIGGQHDNVAAFLLHHGVQVNAPLPYSSQTALLYECEQGGVAETLTHIVGFLLSHGADINKQDGEGETALMLLAQGSDEASPLAFLLSKGAHINVRDREGRTALMDAAMVGNITTLQLLLAHGAHLNLRDKHGKTALDWAVLQGRTDAIALLSRAGAKK